jgi:hypothetical protein
MPGTHERSALMRVQHMKQGDDAGRHASSPKQSATRNQAQLQERADICDILKSPLVHNRKPSHDHLIISQAVYGSAACYRVRWRPQLATQTNNYRRWAHTVGPPHTH